ncbi:MAG TPA: S8 family serine peptidase [Sphingomicrobium sp.]|nr:S8 family serine peptidase [Sphingomicrobium sp.]
MKTLFVCGGVAAFALAAAGTASAKPGDKIAGSYICVFKAGAVAKSNVRAEAGRAAGNGVKHVYSNSIRGFSANAASAAALQSRNPNIAYCEQDQEMGIDQSGPFDFRVVGKPAPSQPAQSVPWGVTRVGGGAGTGSPSGVAFVIDTGIDLDHPDLNTNSSLHRNFVSRETSPEDLNGHGTHVAGTIAAKNNSVGVVGVTPDAVVVAVRVLNRNGRGANSDVIAGVDYVADVGQNGDVANMSLGGGVSQALDSAVIAAAATGVKFTLAAGNESDDANNHSPARANGPNVYTVSSFAQGASATDTVDPWSSFSNFGNPPVDFGEPGSSIPSTYKNGGYATASGTSMAAPHLAGILLTRSTPASGGTVDGDPDGNPDTIGTK